MSRRRPLPFDDSVTTVTLVENLGLTGSGWLMKWTFSNPVTVDDTTFPGATLQAHDPSDDSWYDVGGFNDSGPNWVELFFNPADLPDQWRVIGDPTNLSFPGPLTVPESGPTF